MPTKKPFIKAYLSEEEYARICGLADGAGLSRSEFVRRVCLAREIHSRVDQRAVLALLKSNADLGRLGGLLKQHLAAEKSGDQDELRRLLRSIENSRREVAAGMKEIIRRLLTRKES